MKLLIADDHTLFRDAVAHYIQRAEPDTEILLGSDVHDVMEILEQNNDIDLVMLDFRMPGMEGLQGLKRLRDRFAETPFVLLSGLIEEKDVLRAMDMGAWGYFPKTLSARALLNGIHRVMSGERYVARDHNNGNIMPSHYHGAPEEVGIGPAIGAAAGMNGIGAGNTDAASSVRLTPRESEVLDYLLSGASNKEIARALDIQEVTVKLHVRGICTKLGAKNRTQAALAARALGLGKPVS